MTQYLESEAFPLHNTIFFFFFTAERLTCFFHLGHHLLTGVPCKLQLSFLLRPCHRGREKVADCPRSSLIPSFVLSSEDSSPLVFQSHPLPLERHYIFSETLSATSRVAWVQVKRVQCGRDQVCYHTLVGWNLVLLWLASLSPPHPPLQPSHFDIALNLSHFSPSSLQCPKHFKCRV